MPPRPFPHALRLGTDICNVARIRALLGRSHSGLPYLHRFTKRVLTDPERAYFWNRYGPPATISTKLDTVSQFLAGRFAAKEAIRKACDQFEDATRGYQSIIVLPVAFAPRHKHQSVRPQGLILDAPHVSTLEAEDPEVYTGNTLPIYDAGDFDGQLCEISISHDGDFATAVALVPTTSSRPKASSLEDVIFRSGISSTS